MQMYTQFEKKRRNESASRAKMQIFRRFLVCRSITNQNRLVKKNLDQESRLETDLCLTPSLCFV